MTSNSPEPEGAEQFLTRVEARLLEMATDSQRIDWVYSTHITGDTEVLAARASARYIAQTVEYAKHAVRFASIPETTPTGRKLRLLRLSLSLIAPSDMKENEELTGLVAGMQATYAKGTFAPRGTTEPLDLQGLSRILGKSRDPTELADVWAGWHSVARPMRAPFTRYVELANRG
ncbi:MAG: M2 family metallopeptidase, partial [Thermoplasmata archaeon]|nr:M2 family metallopeptidase [Thermoplasmata archaeon]